MHRGYAADKISSDFDFAYMDLQVILSLGTFVVMMTKSSMHIFSYLHLTYDLYILNFITWPEFCKNSALQWAFVPIYNKIPPHTYTCRSVIITFDLEIWFMCVTLYLMMVNICINLYTKTPKPLQTTEDDGGHNSSPLVALWWVNSGPCSTHLT